MSEDKKPAEKVEAAKPAEAKEETPKAEAPKAKKPMDPKKKKNIIIWSIVGGVTLIGIIVAVVLVIVLSKVDYKESYDLATDLRSKISDFTYDYGDCEYVLDYVESKYTGPSYFSSNVTDCKEILKTDTVDQIKKLGDTSGVQRDGEVKAAFDKFNTEWQKATASIDGEVAAKLDVYDKWHKFIYESSDLYFYSGDTIEDVEAAAKNAIESGNDTLKTYAETWKEKATEVVKARKAYDDATTGTSSLYSTYSSKKSDLKKYVEDNQPKIKEILPLTFSDNAYEIRSAYNDLLTVLSTKYSEKAVEDSLNDVKSYESLLKELMK